MSDELQARIDKLEAENRKLAARLEEREGDLKETRAEARDRRHDARELQKKLDELDATHGDLAEHLAAIQAERDDWRKRAESDPDGLNAKISELTGTVRSMKHEKAFDAVLRDLKVTDPIKRADLLKLADYKAEGDEPDASKIADTFKGVLKDRPWFADAEAGASGAPTTTTTAAGAAPAVPGGTPTVAAPSQQPTGPTPGPGADRGNSLSSAQRPPQARTPGRIA